MTEFLITNTETQENRKVSFTQKSISIGRDKNCDIVLNTPTVSRNHSQIHINHDGIASIVDLDSGNGTLVDGELITPGDKVPLSSHNIITIENMNIQILQDETIDNQEEHTDSGVIEIKMIKKVLGALESEQMPYLEVITAPFEGMKVVFKDDMEELLIGREKKCDLCLESHVISRAHAVLQKKWGGVCIRDLGSKNKVYVNNELVEEKILKNGDIVLLGNIKIVYKNPGEIDLEKLSEDYAKDEPTSRHFVPEDIDIHKDERTQMEGEEDIEPTTAEGGYRQKVSASAQASIEMESPAEEQQIEEDIAEQSEENNNESPEDPNEQLPDDYFTGQQKAPQLPTNTNQKDKKIASTSFKKFDLSPLEWTLIAAGGLILLLGFLGIATLLS